MQSRTNTISDDEAGFSSDSDAPLPGELDGDGEASDQQVCSGHDPLLGSWSVQPKALRLWPGTRLGEAPSIWQGSVPSRQAAACSSTAPIKVGHVGSPAVDLGAQPDSGHQCAALGMSHAPFHLGMEQLSVGLTLAGLSRCQQGYHRPPLCHQTFTDKVLAPGCNGTQLPCRTCTQMSPATSSGRARSCQADCNSNSKHMPTGQGLTLKTVGTLKMTRSRHPPGLARGRSRVLQMPGLLLCSRLQVQVAATRQLSSRCGGRASRLSTRQAELRRCSAGVPQRNLLAPCQAALTV